MPVLQRFHILNKYRFANREIDIDLSYFRYWSVLEAISTVIYNDKHLSTVKKLIQNAYGSEESVNQSINLKIGNIDFSFSQLTHIWYNLRNYAAHNGGLFVVLKREIRVDTKVIRLLDALQNNKIPFLYGEERSLFLLKDVTKKVVNYYLNLA